MSKVLVIEDQQDVIDRFKKCAAGTPLVFVAPGEVDLALGVPLEGVSIEEQLATRLKARITDNDIDLVLLDTDLSRDSSFSTHSSYKAALLELGMPVCRYQKGGTAGALAKLPQLKRTIRDGAAAIWIPRSYVSGDDQDQLVPRLIAIDNGFKAIHAALEARPDLIADTARQSPTEVIAAVLDNPDLAYEFLGYAAQNLVFFSRQEVEMEAQQISALRRYATQLGYWLHNYIITFPGPILDLAEACAYLNVHPDELTKFQALLTAMEPAKYAGPFFEIEPFYWRSGLAKILDGCEGDIAKHCLLSDVVLKRIDAKDVSAAAFICMVSGEPIRLDQAAPNPDWVPSGASQAKIKEEVLDELGPLAGI